MSKLVDVRIPLRRPADAVDMCQESGCESYWRYAVPVHDRKGWALFCEDHSTFKEVELYGDDDDEF